MGRGEGPIGPEKLRQHGNIYVRHVRLMIRSQRYSGVFAENGKV